MNFKIGGPSEQMPVSINLLPGFDCYLCSS